jgi:hypothetical protein
LKPVCGWHDTAAWHDAGAGPQPHQQYQASTAASNRSEEYALIHVAEQSEWGEVFCERKTPETGVVPMK